MAAKCDCCGQPLDEEWVEDTHWCPRCSWYVCQECWSPYAGTCTLCEPEEVSEWEKEIAYEDLWS